MWNVEQVKNHEKLFPFCDHLMSIMFIVASDLDDTQRKRLTIQFSNGKRMCLFIPLKQ